MAVEEIFGLVLPVTPFEHVDDAIRIANDTSYGSPRASRRAISAALRLADRIKAGAVWLNCWHKYHPNAPFGGFKMSEQGCEAWESYTHYKTIWANLA
jgi:aldehyde dehydrogenase (NAD+)